MALRLRIQRRVSTSSYDAGTLRVWLARLSYVLLEFTPTYAGELAIVFPVYEDYRLVDILAISRHNHSVWGCVTGAGQFIGSTAVHRSSLNSPLRVYKTPITWLDVDHENLNRADNRGDNLREATRSQNNANTTVRKHNKLGVKGVSVKCGKYVAHIKINGKKNHLGTHDTIEAAAAAYSKAANDNHGEFARVA